MPMMYKNICVFHYLRKDEIGKNALQGTKDVSRIKKVMEKLEDGVKPLKEFNDGLGNGLFEEMVEKVLKRSKNEFKFWFENGNVVKTMA